MTSMAASGSVGDVRNQRELPRARNGGLQLPLMKRARTGNPARLNLAPLRDERHQQAHVLVVDVVDLVCAELADAPATEEATARPALALVLVRPFAAAAAGSSFFAHRWTSNPSIRSSSSSVSRSPRRSPASGSGDNPRATRRRACVALPASR